MNPSSPSAARPETRMSSASSTFRPKSARYQSARPAPNSNRSATMPLSRARRWPSGQMALPSSKPRRAKAKCGTRRA